MHFKSSQNQLVKMRLQTLLLALVPEWGTESKITMGLPFGAQWPPRAAPRSTIAPQSRQSAPQNPLQHVPHRKIMKKGSPYNPQIAAEP